MANKVLNKRTSGTTFTDSMKTDAQVGELLVAYGSTDPKLGIKDSKGEVVTFPSTKVVGDAIATETGKKADKSHAHGTITLTGDVSGSGKIGSGETAVNISVTVANDSHTHDNRYYTEDEVDAKIKNVSDTIANRYGFSKFQISGETGTTVSADSVTDTVYLSEGFATNITLDKDNDKITFDVVTGTSSTTVAVGNHTHDGRYYTETEIDSLLGKKSDTGHTHDDRYFTEDEVTAKLSTKQDTISDLATIRDNATSGATAYGWGNHANAGYYKEQSATTAQTGTVKLSNSTSSTSQTLAATPKAVKAAYDLANGKWTAVTATTATTGIVKLVEGDMNGATHTDGQAPSLNHTHSQYEKKGQTHTITANASDDDVIILSGTNGTNAVTYSASHADKNAVDFTGGTSTTSISGYGSKGTIVVPKIVVDKKGHVSATDETISIQMPSAQTIPTALKNPTSLTIQKNGTTVATYDGSTATTANIVVPTKFSDLTDDKKVASATTADQAKKVLSGITFTPGSSTAMTASTVYSGDTKATINIPTATSHITNDSGFITSGATVKKALVADKVTEGTIGSSTKPIYISAGTPTECSLGAAANKAVDSTVTSASTALPTSQAVHDFVKSLNYSTTVGTVTSVTVEGASGLTGSGNVKTSGTITIGHGAGTLSAGTHGISSTSNTAGQAIKRIGLDAYGHITGITTGTTPNTTYTFTDNNPTLEWGTKSKVATVGGTAINVTMPANPNTDTATTETGHYAPENSTTTVTASGSLSSWGSKIEVPTINFDSKGHYVSSASTSYTLPSNPNTHYTTHMFVGDSTTTNKHNAASNPYIKILDDSSMREKAQLVGAGATTISSNSAATITITSTDQSVTKADYHYTPTSSTTKGATSGDNYIRGIYMDSKGHVTGVATGTPKDTNTTYTFSDKNATLAWGTATTIATVGGTNINVSLPSNPNTHYTTRIQAGASGTTTNTKTSNPYITVTDDNAYKAQIRLIGGGRTTVNSDSAGTITISSSAPTKVSELTDDTKINAAATADKVQSAITLTYGASSGKTGNTVYSGNSNPTVYVPTATSHITNDSGFITSATTVKYANSAGTATSAGKVANALTFSAGTTSASGNYDGSAAKTVVIPSKTSHITNDSGFITSATTVKYANSAGTATSAGKVSNSLKFGSKTYNGSAEQTITAADLGLGQALRYCGITTTALEDGSTATTIDIKSGTGTTEHQASAGCVVFYGDKEFVFNGNAWELLGAEATYKVVQSPVSDPSASSTSITFIDTISQDANGVIKPTKKTVRSATTAVTGVVKLVRNDLNGYTSTTASTDGLAAAAYHTHSQYLTGETYKGTITGITITAGTGLTSGGTVSASTGNKGGTITIAHADTSTASTTTVSTTGAEAIKGIGLDTFGHVTSITTGTTPDTKSFTITATATDDDVVVLTGTNGTNKVTFDAKHATQGPNATGDTQTSATTSQTPSHGGKATINIPQITVNKYGHVTAVTNQAVSITLPSDNNSAHSHSAGIGLTGSGNAGTSGTYTYKAKLRSETAFTVDSTGATTGATTKIYPVGTDKTGYLATYVPWTDSATTQSGHYKPSASSTTVSVGAQSPSHGGTFNVPTISFDDKGHYVTSGTVKVTLPADTNTWRPVYNGVDSTDASSAATANAVKTAYDKADSAYKLADGKWTVVTATTAATGVVKLVTGDMNGKSHADGQAPSLNHTHSQYVTSNHSHGTAKLTGEVTGSASFTSGGTSIATTIAGKITAGSGITSGATGLTQAKAVYEYAQPKGSYQAAGSYLSANTTYAASSAVGGDAKKAVQLTNTRTIWGQNFNGTANVTGNMTGVGSIAMTGDITGAQNISAAKKVSVGSSAIQYNATTGCLEITA